MSRSYRKPYWKDGYGSPQKKLRKREAARSVRQSEEVQDGSQYKKISNPYNISDYSFQGNPKDWKVARK